MPRYRAASVFREIQRREKDAVLSVRWVRAHVGNHDEAELAARIAQSVTSWALGRQLNG